MTRVLVLVLSLALLAACGTIFAAASPVVGTWQCISTTADGDEIPWTMTVTEQNGKLSGTLSGGPGEFPLIDPTLDGDSFTFKVTVNEQTYSVETKVSGTKLEGTFKGADNHGTLKGTKQ